MAGTDIDVVNIALAKIGEPPISSFGDDRRAAQVASVLYPIVRDAMLRSHPWNCAIGRAILPEEAIAPAFGYTKAFTLPADFLRVVRVRNGNYLRPFYRVEGKSILSDESTIELIYIRRVGEAQMDNLLVLAIATSLAAEMAEPITGSDTKGEKLLAELIEMKLPEARSINAQEEPVEELRADLWNESRFSDMERFRPIEDA